MALSGELAALHGVEQSGEAAAPVPAEQSCTAEEGEQTTMRYIMWLEGELTKAKARLSVYRAEARAKEWQRLASVRGVEVPSSGDDTAVVKAESAGLSGLRESQRAEVHQVTKKKAAPELDKKRTSTSEATGQPAKRVRKVIPRGDCLGCYQGVERGIAGYSHDYKSAACTFTPSNNPARARALKLRAEGRRERGEPEGDVDAADQQVPPLGTLGAGGDVVAEESAGSRTA